MPTSRYSQIVQNPYKSIVPFDLLQSSLEAKQQRYDVNQAAIGRQRDEMYSARYIDPVARKEEIGKFESGIDEIMDKYGGDLSLAQDDVVNFVSKIRESGYYEKNIRQVEAVDMANKMQAQNPNLVFFNDPRTTKISEYEGPGDIQVGAFDPKTIKMTLDAIYEDILRKRRRGEAESYITSTGEERYKQLLIHGYTKQEAEAEKEQVNQRLLSALPGLQKYAEHEKFIKTLNPFTQGYINQLVGGTETLDLGITEAQRTKGDLAKIKARKTTKPIVSEITGIGNTQVLNNPFIDQKNPLEGTDFENIEIEEDFDKDGNIKDKKPGFFKSLMHEAFTTFGLEEEFKAEKEAGTTTSKNIDVYRKELLNRKVQEESNLQHAKISEIKSKNPSMSNYTDKEVIKSVEGARTNKSRFDARKHLYSTISGERDIQQQVTDQVGNDLASRQITIAKAGKETFTGSLKDVYNKLNISDKDKKPIITGLVPALGAYSASITKEDGTQEDILISANIEDQQYLDLILQANKLEMQGNIGNTPVWSNGRPYLVTTRIKGKGKDAQFETGIIALNPNIYTLEDFKEGNVIPDENGNYEVDETSPFTGRSLSSAELILMRSY